MIPFTAEARQRAEAERVAALKASGAYPQEGPGHGMRPGEHGPEDYSRPYITEGHAADAPGNAVASDGSPAPGEMRNVDLTGSRARGVLLPAQLHADMGPAGGGR